MSKISSGGLLLLCPLWMVEGGRRDLQGADHLARAATGVGTTCWASDSIHQAATRGNGSPEVSGATGNSSVEETLTSSPNAALNQLIRVG